MYEWMRGIQGLELVKAEEDPNGDFQRVQLRVKDEKAWERRLVALLKTAKAEDSPFDVAINKSYFLSDAGKPTYAWVLLVFGDFNAAENTLQQLLQQAPMRAVVPPPEVQTRAAAVGVGSKHLRRRVRETDSGKVVEVQAPLPHINHPRNMTLTKNDKTGLNGRHGAAVSTVSEAGSGGSFDE